MKKPKNGSTPLIFSIPSYEYLSQKVCRNLRTKPCELEYRYFPDGERYLRIVSEVRGQDVVLIGGTPNDTSTLDLYDIASGLVQAGCRRLTLFVPFFGYSTMERAVRPREVVTAKTRARLFSSIPLAPFGNSIVLLDLHSEGIPFYFEGGISPVHLYAKSLILKKEAKKLGGKNYSLACTDAGRAKWVESLALDLGVQASFAYKKRLSGSKTEITGVSANVKGKTVLIYDDMIRTGGSVISAAKAYLEGGAQEVKVMTTHGLFTEEGLMRLKNSGLIGSVTCTDSHPEALRQRDGDHFLKVISIAEIFSAYMSGAAYETH